MIVATDNQLVDYIAKVNSYDIHIYIEFHKQQLNNKQHSIW